MEKIQKYYNEIELLFDNWKNENKVTEYMIKNQSVELEINHADGVFVKDGVVCPEQWFSQEIRPLFLLKEAYGGDKDWSLLDYLLSNNKLGKIWQRIAEWTYGLMETTFQQISPYTTELNHKQLGNEYLKKIAVVNIKKSGGCSNSKMEEIMAYAEIDRNYLKCQLKLCDPTIILCGYTGAALDIVMGKSVCRDKNVNRFCWTRLNNHWVLVVDYWHPANQYPDIMNYYGLMGIYQQALRERLKMNFL